MSPTIRAVEPASCPSLTQGTYAYDFGDTLGMTPLMKMHTLGHDFVPDPIHAGGLRYHGMSPLISHLYETGEIEAVAKTQSECFAAGVLFARTEGIVPGARADARARRGGRGGAALQGDRRGEGDPDRAVRARPPRPARRTTPTCAATSSTTAGTTPSCSRRWPARWRSCRVVS